jgi:hypothetical protein
MRNEVNSLQITREDEANGGYIPSALSEKGTRRKGRLAGGVRDKLTMAQMKARMASLWRYGDTYIEIAEQVSNEFSLPDEERITANSVHYHITQMIKYWREKGLIHIDDKQAAILARYDQIELLAIEGYFASCMGKKTTMYDKQIERASTGKNLKSLSSDVATKRDKVRENGNRSRGGRPNSDLLNDPRIDYFGSGEIKDILVLTGEKIKKYRRMEETPAGDPRFLSLLIDINDKRAKLFGLGKVNTTNGDQELARLSDEDRSKRLVAVINQAIRRVRGGPSEALASPAPLGGFPARDEDIPIPPEGYGEEDVPIEDEDDWGDLDETGDEDDEDIWGD